MSIATEIERLLQAKADLKISIEAKGVSLADDATLDDYPDAIDQIETGGGASDVVRGSFIFNDDGAKTVSIPYSGNGYITTLLIRVKDGLDDADFAQLTRKNATEAWCSFKMYPQKLPIGGDAKARRFVVKKSSSSDSDSYTSTNLLNCVIYDAGLTAQGYDNTLVVINSATQISVFMSSTGTGFATGIEYEYVAVYSE